MGLIGEACPTFEILPLRTQVSISRPYIATKLSYCAPSAGLWIGSGFRPGFRPEGRMLRRAAFELCGWVLPWVIQHMAGDPKFPP